MRQKKARSCKDPFSDLTDDATKLNDQDIFINFTGERRDKRTRRTIRSQAAKSSAASRIETIRAKATGNYEALKFIRKEFEASSLQDASAIHPAAGFKFIRISDKAPPRSAVVKTLLPSRSPLGQGRVDPFGTFPTDGTWHPCFPKLVDTYLTYVASPAPSSKKEVSPFDRQSLRTQLWPEVISSKSLFFANLLVAAFQESISRRAFPNSSFTAWIRQMAIQSINVSLRSVEGPPDNATVAAVSMLAGFELEFGDSTAFDTHMKGLQSIVAMRGGLDSATLPTVVKHLILNVGYDLPQFSGRKPYFRPSMPTEIQEISDGVPGELPSAFSKLRKMGILQPTMLCLISDLHTINPFEADSAHKLDDIRERLRVWHPTLFAACNFCPIQSEIEDNINGSAHHLIRVAALCLVSRLETFLPPKTACQAMDLEAEARPLRLECISQTVFKEVGLWALFVIVTTIQQSSRDSSPLCIA